jgi:hypothetical protein
VKFELHSPNSVLLFLTLITVFMICLSKVAGMVQPGEKYPEGRKLLFGSFGVSFIGLFILTFLSPYFLATLMFVGSWWWLPLVLLGAGGGGGAIRVYDQSGNRVGTFYEK